jgi:ribonuclease-3
MSAPRQDFQTSLAEPCLIQPNSFIPSSNPHTPEAMAQDPGQTRPGGNGTSSKDKKRKRNHSPSRAPKQKKTKNDNDMSLAAYARAFVKSSSPPDATEGRNQKRNHRPIEQNQDHRSREHQSRDPQSRDHQGQHEKSHNKPRENGVPSKNQAKSQPNKHAAILTKNVVIKYPVPPDSNAYLKKLLEEVIDGEAGLSPDQSDAVEHAKALHASLFLRPREYPKPAPQVELDKIAPAQGTLGHIPGYVANHPTVRLLPSGLPPLPPIKEYHLEYAAFRHVSHIATRGHSKTEELTYEKLEFLGDAYIEVIASRILFNRFPQLLSGQQAQLRELMVKNVTLAQYSRAYGFDNRILHHIDEARGEDRWMKVCADVFEAYVACLVLADPENGFHTAEVWLTALWAPLLADQQRVKEFLKPIDARISDAKQELARLLLHKGVKIEYKEEQPMEMTMGLQKYFMGCYLTGYGWESKHLGSGSGPNKSEAGAFAAADALKTNMDIIMKANEEKKRLFPPPPVPQQIETTEDAEKVEETKKTEATIKAEKIEQINEIQKYEASKKAKKATKADESEDSEKAMEATKSESATEVKKTEPAQNGDTAKNSSSPIKLAEDEQAQAAATRPPGYKSRKQLRHERHQREEAEAETKK